VIGIPLTLIGLLAVAVGIGMVGNPGPQGGPPPIAAQVIAVLIIAGVPALGIVLCWLGLRRRSKPKTADTPVAATGPSAPELVVAAPPQDPAGGLPTATDPSPSVAAAPGSAGLATMSPPADHDDSFGYADGPGDYDEQLSGDYDEQPSEEPESSSPVDDGRETFQVGASGRLIGKCGPKMSGQFHYYVIGGGVVVAGFAVMIGLNVAPGAADPATASKLGFGLGSGLVLFGGAILGSQLMRAPQTILLYDDRLEEESGDKRRTIRLDQIVGLHLQEFYEHRFAPQTLLVTVRVNGQRDLKFSTALGDDADLIVQCLADIAPDVEVREFMG
jgi:hypothetical protein